MYLWWGIFLSFMLLIIILCLMSSDIVGQFKISYFSGVKFWSKILPFMATTLFIFIIFANLSSRFHNTSELLSDIFIKDVFDKDELFILVILSPFFFTTFGNFFALIVTIYLSTKIFHSSSLVLAQPGFILILSGTIIISLLADKMFTIPVNNRSRIIGEKIRSITKIGISLLSIILALQAISNISSTVGWLKIIVKYPNIITPAIIIFFLLCFSIGWGSILFERSKHYLFGLLCIPTVLLVQHFILKNNYQLAIIPTVVCICLMLAAADKRTSIRLSE